MMIRLPVKRPNFEGLLLTVAGFVSGFKVSQLIGQPVDSGISHVPWVPGFFAVFFGG